MFFTSDRCFCPSTSSPPSVRPCCFAILEGCRPCGHESYVYVYQVYTAQRYSVVNAINMRKRVDNVMKPCHAMPCHAMPCHAMPCYRTGHDQHKTTYTAHQQRGLDASCDRAMRCLIAILHHGSSCRPFFRWRPTAINPQPMRDHQIRHVASVVQVTNVFLVRDNPTFSVPAL